ncbi:MAG: glutamate formimidoyltransferase [Actinomycetota bacterium]|nr:glutamate formimidoyltransferase [Actinomycetota bacterium]
MLEAVPNVSEGRKAAAIEEIGRAFASRAGLLDVHADADHHRSVFTLAAFPDPLVESLITGIARALELVDLRAHDGVHPRVGAVDVVPLVPIVPSELAAAEAAARAVAERVGEELQVPVFLYGTVGGGKRPAFFRSGGLAELERRVIAGELRADAGPSRIDPRSGAVLVGARRPLVAYNVELAAADVSVARAIAAAIRESGGGMPGVQAIGLELPRSGRIQVSMNVLDLERAPLHEVVKRVRQEAASRGAEVVDGELVGLVPERVWADAAAAGVSIPGVSESRVLEQALGRSAF